jgi:hypothetical protein
MKAARPVLKKLGQNSNQHAHERTLPDRHAQNIGGKQGGKYAG